MSKEVYAIEHITADGSSVGTLGDIAKVMQRYANEALELQIKLCASHFTTNRENTDPILLEQIKNCPKVKLL